MHLAGPLRWPVPREGRVVSTVPALQVGALRCPQRQVLLGSFLPEGVGCLLLLPFHKQGKQASKKLQETGS